jgi:hypothetical protein
MDTSPADSKEAIDPGVDMNGPLAKDHDNAKSSFRDPTQRRYRRQNHHNNKVIRRA